jgi:hypothetical protein
MLRLYTAEQVYRAFRKELKQHQIHTIDQLRDILFDMMESRLMPQTYLDYLTDLYDSEYIDQDTFDDAFEAIYLYYGDLITSFIEDYEEEL